MKKNGVHSKEDTQNVDAVLIGEINSNIVKNRKNKK